MNFRWVDANVILRFITGDPPEMAAKALALMTKAEKGAIALRISPLILAETTWVLHSFYKYSRRKIAEVLLSFILADGIYPENPLIVKQALIDMANKNVDFADAYLAAIAKSLNEPVSSFDNDFDKLDTKWIIPPD